MKPLKAVWNTISFDRFPNKELYEEAGDDSIKAMAIRYKKMFAECGIYRRKSRSLWKYRSWREICRFISASEIAS